MWFFVLVGLILLKCSDGAVEGLFAFLIGVCRAAWWTVRGLCQALGWIISTCSPRYAKTYVVEAEPATPGILAIARESNRLTNWSPAELREQLDAMQGKEEEPVRGRIIDHARIVY